MCCVFSLLVLWSEVSVAPWMGLQFGDAQKGSVLLYSVCLGVSVPPSCIHEDRIADDGQTPYYVSSTVQNIIILHLFYLCGVAHFSLTRMRLFGLYEVVPGETGACRGETLLRR